MAKSSVSPIAQMIRRLTEDHRIKNLPDQELLQRFTSGHDEAAFAGLVRRHGAMVLQVCRNAVGNEADAEDAFQATFLVLAQKAGSIRIMTSVGSWLYGVAHRIALKHRQEHARRQKHESRAPRSRNQEPADELPWCEVQQLIHAEIATFSERYRAPLVLCFLEGRTQDEAAKQLGVCKATLIKRLERGRSLLRRRLVRRGLGPAAVLAASAWPGAMASACLRPTLVSTTVKAATALAAGQTPAGLISVQVGYLMAHALTATLATKLKVATAVLLALALVPTFGGWAFHSQSTRRAVAKGATVEPVPQPAASGRLRSRLAKVEVDDAVPPGPQKTRTLSGRVLDSAGEPAAGAKLLLVGAGDQFADLGRSAADGRFTVTVAAPIRVEFLYPRQHLVAQVAGAGLDFIRVPEPGSTDPIELRLVRDLPIRGRVVNTEGKPVAGAKLFVTDIRLYADNSVDSFLTQWKNQHLKVPYSTMTYWLPDSVRDLYLENESLLSATTDDVGRFTIAGVGIERSVELEIRGSGIAACKVLVVNRDQVDLKPYNQAAAEFIAKIKPIYGYAEQRVLYGPDLSVVAEADRPIRGVVKDIDTGKPRVGVRVWLSRIGGQLLQTGLTAITDTEGRYEVRGARKGESYTLEVPSDPASGFMRGQVRAPDKPGIEPITADIVVKKGVIVTGRVLDAATKKVLPGWVKVEVLVDNPFVKEYPEFLLGGASGIRETGEDGKFRFVTIPGPVVLMGGPSSVRVPEGELVRFKYKPAVADPDYPRYFQTHATGFTAFNDPRGGINALEGNFCKVLEIKPGAEIVTQDVVVEPDSALPVKIQDAVGRPLTGTWVTGIYSTNRNLRSRPFQVKTDSCSAYALEPGMPRLMLFYAEGQKLIGTLTLKGDEKEPGIATLGQPGAVTGRLIGDDGKPLVGVIVNLRFTDHIAEDFQKHIHRAKLIETNIDGAFKIDTVVPGLKFSLGFSRGVRTFEPLMKLEDRSVQAGGTLDLGDVKVKRKAEEEN